MTWNGIWLKHGQQPAESFIDQAIITGKIVLMRVSKPKANTLNICCDEFLGNFHDF